MVMTTIDLSPPELDPELAERLQRLAAHRAVTRPATTAKSEIDAGLGARVQHLAERPGPRAGAEQRVTSGGTRRRRHPARKSRLAALALSLATTGGLTAGFAAIDGPSSSTVNAVGGVVDAASSATTGASGQPAALPPSGAGSPAVPAATTSVVNGDLYTNRWGPVQVQATFAVDGSLASVDAVQTPFRDGQSVRINDRAVPALNSEALGTQSAQVDTVSGATYTSVDYRHSLQSAIDAARAAGITQIA